jgi:hypothetical protein
MARKVSFSVSMSLDGFITPGSLGELMGQQWMDCSSGWTAAVDLPATLLPGEPESSARAARKSAATTSSGRRSSAAAPA